jgi:WD40 repeat protein
MQAPPQGDWVLDAAYSPKDGRVAIAASDGGLGGVVARIWDPRSAPASAGLQTKHLAEARTVDFARTGAQVLFGGAGDVSTGDLEILDPVTRLVTHVERFDQLVTAARFSPDGRRVAVALDRGLALADPSGQKPPVQVAGRDGPGFYSVAFSPRGDLLAAGDMDGGLHIYDARTLKRVRRVQAHGSAIMSVAFSTDGRRVATASSDQTARVWDARDWSRKPTELRPGTGSGTVADAEFSPDGRRIVTGGADRTIRVWDAGSGRLVGVATPHADYVNSVEFSRDGGWILSASDDQSAKITRCPTCVAGTGELVKLAALRSTRKLTDGERRTYLGK